MNSIVTVMLISLLRLAIPIVICGIGNMYCEKSGVMNLGAEGMMISGAFGAVAGTYLTGSPWLGVLCGLLGGLVVGFAHGLICVEFGGYQNISGLGLNMLAAGLTSFCCRSLFGTGLSPAVASIQTTPVLKGIPGIGGFLQQFSPIAYITIALVAVSWYVVKYTTAGLRMTAIGDDPQTAVTAGIDIWKIRMGCVMLCGALAGLAGAYMSIGQLNIFMEDMTNGKGMLAVIAVKMGRWEPKRIVLIALLFGFFDALQLQLQMNNAFHFPPELSQTSPFVVGILILAKDSVTATNPQALAKPFLKNKYKF